MNQESEFPFERARRITSAESQEFRSAIVEQFGIDLKKRVCLIKEAHTLPHHTVVITATTPGYL